MSIIHNALKKTQEKLNQQDKNPSTSSSVYNSQNTSMPDSSNQKKSPTLIYILCAAISIVIAFSFYILTQTNQTPGLLTFTPKESKTNQALDNIVPLLQIESTKKPRIQLQGIMQADGKNAALINDDVYEEGEIVDGMTITMITLEKVELDNNGEKIILRVKR